MIRSVRVFVAAMSLAAATAWAAPCPSGLPYRFLRYDEDFGYLRDPACRTDPWDAVKFIALDAGGGRFLTLGGDVRVRVGWSRNALLGDDLGDNDHVVPQRYHVHASLRAAGWLRVFGELKFNDVSGREPGPAPVDVDRGDVHQLFVDVQPAAGATFRVGRQELLYGSGRRIFPANGPNVRGTFDAVRVVTSAGSWRADGFVFRPVEMTDKGAFDDSSIETQTFGGIYAVATPASIKPFALDLYWIAGRRERVRFDQGLGTDYRHSLGARIAGVRAPWDIDVEATWQVGRFGAGDIRAWAVTADGGHGFAGALPVRAALRLSAASGDRDRSDPDLQTFHWLFPKGNTLDNNFAIATANQLFARVALEVGVAPNVRVSVDAAWMGRSSLSDTAYRPNGTALRPAGPSRAREVGKDAGVVVQWQADRHALLFFQAAVLDPGAFLRDGGFTKRMKVATAGVAYRF